jgi:predicted RNA-binding Zn-ribbon protein involved in translation (DUF1610 family)
MHIYLFAKNYKSNSCAFVWVKLMKVCSSCGRKTIDYVEIPCPSCGETRIVRCRKCREIVNKYKCEKCGWVGP